MKFKVNAMSVNPVTGEVTGPPRIEVIDNEENHLFRGAKTPWDVEDVYHAFWNRLNDYWETDFPAGKDKVVVLSVREVTA